MSSVIQNILDNTIGDGARSSKFECFINIPSQIFNNESDIVYMAKTSQFPGKTNEVIDLKFKGRNIPVKGQVKFDNTWTCTFYLTENHYLKKAFEDWVEGLEQIHNMNLELDNSVKTVQSWGNANGYTTSMQIAQVDFHGDKETIIYNMYNVFPKSISVVDVDASTVGTVSEFTVEFSYSYYDCVIKQPFVIPTSNQILNNGVLEVPRSISDIFAKIFNIPPQVSSIIRNSGARDINTSVILSENLDNMINKLI